VQVSGVALRDLGEPVNNAGIARYMPLADLPADEASKLVNVKGTIINLAGWLPPDSHCSTAWPRRHRSERLVCLLRPGQRCLAGYNRSAV
jgi:hypothetical protein